ncbi:hypothetical protein CLV62_104176 [Dysgonomonas alginatilytica]|uniref:Uncharacterized protein n=1 Tax=Dysgonomonas alginatilytica TaxID=1605892 RepID=A0A2V3PUC0_9BACT|nr:hypothetical protein [Dysgonomonas alginatilytica]PXV66915.1 hypothetical protein CLV62_104176 [Dysgonomonas alginatilytica]
MEKQIGLGTGNGAWLLDMYIEAIHVTPESAQEILEKYNIKNRDVNEIHIGFLANQMIRDMWIERSGLAIKFDENMNMVDGQQRLLSIIESGKPQNLLSICNVDQRAFEILDTQRTRTASDTFKISGYQYHVQLAALTKRYMLLIRHTLDYNISSKRQKITPNDQLNEYRCNKELYDEILQKGIKLNSAYNILTTTDYCGFISYLIKHKGHEPEKVYSFFNQFASIERCICISIEEVRRRLVNARNSGKRDKNRKYVKRSGLSDSLKTSYIAIAWNAFITNRHDLQEIRFEDGEHFL